MLCIGGRKSRNKVIVGEPAIGSFWFFSYVRLFLLFNEASFVESVNL